MTSTWSRLRTLVGALLLWGCASAQAYVIGLTPSVVTDPLIPQFSVDVVVSGLETDGQILSVYDLTVGFDQSLLQLVNAQEAGALGAGSLFLFTPGAGNVNLFEVSALSDAQLAAQQGDSLTLATLWFIGIGAGTSSLVFSDLFVLGGAQILNPGTGQLEVIDLLALPHTVVPASVTIDANAVPEPAPLPLLALALAFRTVRHKRERR